MNRRFHSFAEFYPFYLDAHSNRANRRLHVAGVVASLILILAFLATWNWRLLAAVPVVGYGLSWIGHFVFEKNRPAAFGHPWYSFLGDLAMFRDTLRGRIQF